MANLKATKQAAIDAFVDGGNAPASQFRTQQTTELNDRYDSQIDTQILQLVTTKSGSVLTYELFITKCDGLVTATIKFKNTLGSNVTNNTPVFTWKATVGGQNNPYIPKAGWLARSQAFDSALSGYMTKVLVTDAGMTLPKGATAGMEYDSIVITYPSKY